MCPGSGVGYSWGGKGYRVTHMANGRTRRTATIPGTGISYVSESGGSSGRGQSAQQPQEMALGQTEQHESADRTDYTDCEYADLMKQLHAGRHIQRVARVPDRILWPLLNRHAFCKRPCYLPVPHRSGRRFPLRLPLPSPPVHRQALLQSG